jgi:outer membrane murein-binding lipoprotein Lpp
VDKNALEHLLSSYNWWMGVSTVAVAIGILGEYVAHFIFEEDARRNKREMAVSILFGVLVLGGVVGEYIFGKKLSQASEQLQQMADAEVAQSNKDAAQARRDAETAKGDAAKANEKAGKANERASKNEKEAAQLRKDAAKLEASVEWRRLSKEQKKAFADKLKRYAGQRAAIRYNSGDSEGASFAASIADVLICADWKVSLVPPLFPSLLSTSGLSPTGVGIQSGVDDSSTAASKPPRELLVKLLNGVGFDADTGFTWKSAPGSTPEERQTIAIAVRHRPEGPQGEYKLQAERDAKAKKKQVQSNHAAK